LGKLCWAGRRFLRRLATIGAANVRCRLRLMEAGDEGALARLERLRRHLIDPKAAFHEGRTLKPAGAVEPTPIAAG
jgi:hypothetical protein